MITPAPYQTRSKFQNSLPKKSNWSHTRKPSLVTQYPPDNPPRFAPRMTSPKQKGKLKLITSFPKQQQSIMLQGDHNKE